MCAPANTPATPPNFPDALAAFAKLSTTPADKMNLGGACSPVMYATSPKSSPMMGVTAAASTQTQQPFGFNMSQPAAGHSFGINTSSQR